MLQERRGDSLYRGSTMQDCLLWTVAQVRREICLEYGGWTKVAPGDLPCERALNRWSCLT